MQELFDSIQAKMIEFNNDLNLNVNKGNKAAGVRARKASLELEKMFKEYRKKSLESAKK
ncbi:histone H1 [Clavibacter sp.]|uniref:histone H1 n=1 Tax=Clavibacter sp. TaxID=1871044 RepID=UPI0019BA405C|nr:histone H1 [Clavibacter sp.]MBD5381997.1 histone H1 [Clavibacter sp.]